MVFDVADERGAKAYRTDGVADVGDRMMLSFVGGVQAGLDREVLDRMLDAVGDDIEARKCAKRRLPLAWRPAAAKRMTRLPAPLKDLETLQNIRPDDVGRQIVSNRSVIAIADKIVKQAGNPAVTAAAAAAAAVCAAVVASGAACRIVCRAVVTAGFLRMTQSRTNDATARLR